MENDLNGVARQLHDWFGNILHLTDASVFSIAPEGPHRDAVVLDVLKRNARILLESELDTGGKLYSPLGFFMAAACRKLGTALGIGHWKAAVDNVVQLQRKVADTREKSELVGLEIGSPAALFKQDLDESINQAGLAGPVSYLDKASRQIAIGLSINWGMRFLLAYAVECSRPVTDPNRKDLAWLAKLLRPLLVASTRSQ